MWIGGMFGGEQWGRGVLADSAHRCAPTRTPALLLIAYLQPTYTHTHTSVHAYTCTHTHTHARAHARAHEHTHTVCCIEWVYNAEAKQNAP